MREAILFDIIRWDKVRRNNKLTYQLHYAKWKTRVSGNEIRVEDVSWKNPMTSARRPISE